MSGRETMMGSKDINETEIEQEIREAQWRLEHSCPICQNFECDGNCNTGVIIQ